MSYLVPQDLQCLLCCRCSLVGMNVRQRSCIICLHFHWFVHMPQTLLSFSSFKGLQWYILFLFLEGLYWLSKCGYYRKQHPCISWLWDSSCISKQGCDVAFDLLYYMLGTVLGASLDPFHSDGSYSICWEIMWQFWKLLSISILIMHSGTGEITEWIHRLFEPITLSLM